MNLRLYAPIYLSLFDNILDQNSFTEEDKKFWPNQISLLKKIINFRNNLTDNNYEETLIKFIIINEGCTLYPYICPAGLVTIGTGFALTFKNSFKLTEFGKMLLSQINFDTISFELNILSQIKEKKKIITAADNEKILSFLLKTFKLEILNFMPFFDNLSLNIKISLQSLYYNNHIFIKGNVLENLKQFIETTNEEFLKNVLFCICRNCNRGAPYKDAKTQTIMPYWKGIQYRRYREMIMASNSKLDEFFFDDL